MRNASEMPTDRVREPNKTSEARKELTKRRQNKRDMKWDRIRTTQEDQEGCKKKVIRAEEEAITAARRRSAIEVRPDFSEAPHIRSSIPH